MERELLDDLIQVMGVTGHLARREILDQAEGRPGWAIALADLILRKNDPRSLITGRGLSGEVGRYLRRAGLTNATDVLTAVSALGWLPEPDLGRLSRELQLPRAEVAGMIRTAPAAA